MTTVPLGHSAYRRLASGAPEVRVENRYLETSPTNLREHAMILSRPGTSELAAFPQSPGFTAGKPMRGNFTKLGLFNSALFTVSGTYLYRYDTDNTRTLIVGDVHNNGFPVATWMKGIGYEFLFIADGLLLQFYAGPTPSTATLTLTGAITNQVLDIGGTFYGWNVAVDTGAPDGSAAHPWLANPGTDALLAMVNLLTFNGVPGVDFSTALGGPSATVTATVAGGPPATSMLVSSIATDGSGNLITTTLTGTGGVLAWSSATLINGGINALQGVAVPDGQAVKALASVSGYVLVSIANSQKFYWLNPGETVIDPLNFATKESNPDNIVDMNTVGDQVLINGGGSTENWYATGNLAAPFAPVEGRVYARGAVPGTVCPVQDGVILVGNDGVVYQVGSSYGSGTSYGVTRISDHGIEERVRRQLRREQGLAP